MTELKIRQAFVSAAKADLGVKEGSARHKALVDLYNSHKPLARGYPLKYTDAWCAGYVSAKAIECDLTVIIPTEVSCGKMIELAKKMGIWVEDDAYVPLPGDLPVYDWDDNGKGDNTGSPDHIGIAEKVENGIIRVVEGNKDNQVAYRDIPVNGRYLRGFIVPKFAQLATAEPIAFKDVPADAWYASHVDTLSSLGLVEGTGNGMYEPDRPVTRGELAAIIGRLLEHLT